MMLPITFLATLLLTNAADVASTVIRGNQEFSFRLSGTIILSHRTEHSQILSVEDVSGCTIILADAPTNGFDACSLGDRILASGAGYSNTIGRVYARCNSVRVISHGREVPPIRANASALKRGEYDNRRIAITGSVRDVFTDEIDPLWIFCILDCHPDRLFITVRTEPGVGNNAFERLKTLIGATVSATGLCSLNDLGFRRLLGRTVTVNDLNDIKIVTPPSEDPFNAPLVTDLVALDPGEITSLNRQRLVGTVIAAWNRNRLLVRDSSGEVRKIELANAPLPRFGERIEAVGLPETDLYRINLSSAIFRLLNPAAVEFETVDKTPVAQLFCGKSGLASINPALHGKTIRIQGIVNDLPSNVGTFTIKSDTFTVAVNVSELRSSCPQLSIGSLVDVTGVCVVETENWRPYSPFPHTTGITFVPRRAEDIIIVSEPPWWTPTRLLAVIGALIVSLLVIAAWNFTLKRIIHRRSRQLFKEQIARTSSELRVDERTRLAVELHDSIAQNLTGISFEIDAAERFADTDLAKMRKHLIIAANSLRSCRGELRNCLWDLRHQALESANMESAIRQTLEPHVAGIDLFIRFNVPRERISDSSAHAILRIIRELTVNAIRHGKATAVWVAGSLESNALKFSVRDNGSGFDTENCPGDEQGHYGLLGIRERVNTFEGTFKIESKPGKGTKATICLNTIRETKT